MARQEFPKSVKSKAAERAKGHCEQCGKKLRVGEFHYDHRVADGLGGTPTLDNCMVLCLPCHKDKTHLHDNPIMQKADRQRKAVAQGIRTPKKPMPFGRNSGLKMKMNGEIVDRRTGRVIRGGR
jgi:5-methylcytosine-specific restriction endonuclease McrA